MIYCFDLDGTICTLVHDSLYQDARPYPEVVSKINNLYASGHVIKIMTARGTVSKVDWTGFTRRQLNSWGIKYHELITNQKPHADIFIDDRAVNALDWKKTLGKRAIVAGAFDVLHPGYIRMFKYAWDRCGTLTVALHVDPTIDRPFKIGPVQTPDERAEILKAIRYVDDVILYHTEEDLKDLIRQYDVRVLGEDYRDAEYTGPDIPVEILWVPRDHQYSTTLLKSKIYDQLEKM